MAPSPPASAGVTSERLPALTGPHTRIQPNRQVIPLGRAVWVNKWDHYVLVGRSCSMSDALGKASHGQFSIDWHVATTQAPPELVSRTLTSRGAVPTPQKRRGQHPLRTSPRRRRMASSLWTLGFSAMACWLAGGLAGWRAGWLGGCGWWLGGRGWCGWLPGWVVVGVAAAVHARLCPASSTAVSRYMYYYSVHATAVPAPAY